MRLIWQLLAVVAVWILGNLGTAAVKDDPWPALVAGLLTAVVAVLVYGWVVRRTEHRAPVEVSREGAGAATGWGTLLGIALFGAVIANIAFFGDYTINGLGTPSSAVAIAIEAGGMLTAAYIATRKLWVPIGLHFGWNIAASAIFSTEVSGSSTPQGLLDATMSGPALVTGGDFGPEGSVYAVVFGVVATGVFMWLAHRRGHVVPARRSARTDVAAGLAG